MSVLLQSYPIIEVIIIDDGSIDDTIETIRNLVAKWPKTVVAFSQYNSGPGSARELGVKRSSGELIQFLDSDDILLPRKLEEQVRALEDHPHAGICYGLSFQADHSFNPPLLIGPIRSTGEEILSLFPKLLNERWWTTSSPLYRRKLVVSIGPWKNLLNEEDWEFDARAGKSHTLTRWISIGCSIRRINLEINHLSSGGSTDKAKITNRVIAKHLLYEHAKSAGIKNTSAEMVLFARECFLISRQCAEIDLERQSQLMFQLSRRVSSHCKMIRIDMLIYWLCGNVLGWVRTGKLAARIRRI